MATEELKVTPETAEVITTENLYEYVQRMMSDAESKKREAEEEAKLRAIQCQTAFNTIITRISEGIKRKAQQDTTEYRILFHESYDRSNYDDNIDMSKEPSLFLFRNAEAIEKYFENLGFRVEAHFFSDSWYIKSGKYLEIYVGWNRPE